MAKPGDLEREAERLVIEALSLIQQARATQVEMTSWNGGEESDYDEDMDLAAAEARLAQWISIGEGYRDWHAS